MYQRRRWTLLGWSIFIFVNKNLAKCLMLIFIFSALLILCVGLGISSLIFMIEKLIVKFAKK